MDPAAKHPLPSPGEAAWHVVIDPTGESCQSPAHEPLLHALERAGIEWPSSCRNGTCRTCIGQLAAGQARHAIPWPGLSAEEKAAGCVLPCVAHAESDLVLRRTVPR